MTEYTIRSIEPTSDGRMRFTYVVTATLAVRHLTLSRAQIHRGGVDHAIRHAIEHVRPKPKVRP